MPVRINIPEKLEPFLLPMRYKVAYGGRGGAKSQTVAQLLLAKGASGKRRILCVREVQRSIRDSVHALLVDMIKELGLESFYEPLATEIRGRNGTEILFAGLSGQTIQSIKSYQGIDDVWAEEAHTIVRNSWNILIPTIRKDNSEIWVTFNPDMDTDDTYQRFVENPPPDSIVIPINYDDNPWFPEVLEKERAYAQKTLPKDDYENIWLGKTRLVVEGAIFPNEVREMVESGRIIRVPHNPQYPVHTFWDLGWNDKMVVVMCQKPHPSAVDIIDYYEDSHKKYSDVVVELDKRGYRWGVHWLPPDGASHHPTSGLSAQKALVQAGWKNVFVLKKSDPDDAVRQARMVFPRVAIDKSDRSCETGYRGGKRLVACLKALKRTIPTTTKEAGGIFHDEYSHAGSAFTTMCVLIDRVSNDYGAPKRRRNSGFTNPDASMGVLG